MSRSHYIDDGDGWQTIMWRGAVKKAVRGKRGQAFLQELLAALDAVAGGRLIANDLQDSDGEVCALGAIGKARGVDMTTLDPEAPEAVAQAFGVAPALVREIVYENDEVVHVRETPEQRFLRVRTWVLNHIVVK
jgi:hypothetical protein